MDHRDRAAPVALPADAPVAQPPVHHALADAQPLQFRDRRAPWPPRRSSPSRKPELKIRARPDIGLDRRSRNAPRSSPGGSTTGTTFRPYLRAKSRSRWSWPGQPKIAPVPYSISTKLAIQTGKVASGRNGWRDPQPGVVAALLRRLDRRLAGAHAAAFGDERGRRRVARRDARRPADAPARPPGTTCRTACPAASCRPRPRRCRLHRRGQSEPQPRALAAADPVRLHHPHPFGPAIEAVERGQQLRRIARDLQEPLRELTSSRPARRSASRGRRSPARSPAPC